MSEPDIDFLSEEVADEVVPVETTDQTTETVVETPETPAAEVTTTPATKEEERVPLAALMAEREKRQEIERQRKDLEKRIAEIEKAKLPDFYENPEEHVRQIVQEQSIQVQQRLYAALEEQARDAYPDFDEVMAEVQAQAEQNPTLVQEIFSKANPAIAAYKLGKKLREHKEMQDPEAYRAKLKAEIVAELQAADKAKEDAKRKAVESIPPNLTDARAAKDDGALPDESLETILKR